MDDVALRDAVIDDAPLLARIDVQSWRETYAGLLSAPLLAGLDRSPFHDALYWQGVLARPRSRQWVWLIGADPIGLCHVCVDDEGGGLVDRLYLLRQAQRRGLGRRVMSLVAHRLIARGPRPLSVWALECNLPAQTFYERLGGRRLPRRPVFEDAGESVFEVGFRWERPESLVA